MAEYELRATRYLFNFKCLHDMGDGGVSLPAFYFWDVGEDDRVRSGHKPDRVLPV
jgi:hypothetical protein